MTDSSLNLELGPYQLIRPLGRGAMGVVYAARHKISGQLVAIKTLELNQMRQGSADASQRFVREIQAAIALDHPNIVRCFDFARTQVRGLGEVLYYAMEMIIGETLHQMLQRGPLPLAQAAAVAIDVAQALDCAHRHGIVHRDIKPANIFVRQDRQILVADFGVCRMEDQATLTAAGGVIGTLSYMAPEQAGEEPVDARADLFALGATLFSILSRKHLRPPSAAQALKQILQAGADLRALAATVEIPAEVRPILTRALAYDVDQRYQNAAELIRDLRPLAGELPLPQIADAQALTLTEGSTLAALPAPPPVLPAAAVPTLAGPIVPAELEPAAPGSLSSEALFADIAPSPSGAFQSARTGEQALVRTGSKQASFGAPLESGALRASAVLSARQSPPEPSRSPWLKRVALIGSAVLLLFVVVPFALRLRSLQISVDSLPQGAAVRVDGEIKGITPCTITLDNRHHAVELSIESWLREPYQRRIEPPLWGALPPILAAMPHERVWLKVSSEPAGAALRVDGKPRCTTPCLVQDLAPARVHVIDFVRPGCAPNPVLIEGQPGEHLLLEHRLLPRTPQSIALLHLLSDADATELDGEDRSQDLRRGPMFVEAGEHLLVLKRGHHEQRESLYLQGGKTYRIDLRPGAHTQPVLALPQEQGPPMQNDAEDEGALDDGESVDLNQRRAPLHGQLLSYGLYLLSRGLPEQAASYLSRALSLGPRRSASHRGIIALAMARHDAQLARGQIAALLALQGDEPDADLLVSVYASVQKATTCVPDPP